MWRLATALLLGLLIGALSVATPRPQPATAPADAFSTGRAMADIAVIGAAPHAIGSARNAQVRDYLIGRMGALGLSPRVQRDDAFALRGDADNQAVFGATVENLIGVLPGRDRSAPALALMAHYDSAPGSPGAGDDAAGVAAVLETVRALKVQGVPTRDVLVVLTDGEEQGLIGAQAFFERDPAAAHVGLVVNLETRGGAGPAVMFETSAGDGALIAAFARTAARHFTGSVANFAYQRMPNSTDFSVAKAAGKAGLNFAFLGRQFDYHSPTATPENLSQGSVQSMGDQALAAARAFAFAQALPPRASDAVFSHLIGPLIVAYPPWVGWLPLAVAVGLIAVAAVRAHRREPLKAGPAGLGLLAGLAILAGAAGLLWLGRVATGIDFGFLQQRPLLARFGLWEAAMALIGAGATALVFAGLGRRGSWLGLLIGGGIAAAALQIWLPLIAYVVAWPVLAAALAAAISSLGTGMGRWTGAGVTLLAAVSLGWLGGLAHGLATALDAPWGLALFVWLAALALWPLLEPLAGRRGGGAAAALLLAAAALVGVIRFTSPWSPRKPQATIVYYVADQASGRFWRAASPTGFGAGAGGAGGNGEWAKAAVAPGGEALQRPALWPLLAKPFAAPAPAVAHPAYAVTLTQDSDCTVRLSAPWIAGGRGLDIDLRSSAPAGRETVLGRPAALFARTNTWTSLYWRRMDGGVNATFRPTGAGTVELRYAMTLDRWPADARPLPPRPRDVMAWGDSDALGLIGSLTLAARGCA